jgi:hypothetical protein
MWLTPKGTIAVYERREQELYTYGDTVRSPDQEHHRGRYLNPATATLTCRLSDLRRASRRDSLRTGS